MGKLDGWNIGFIGLGLMGRHMARHLHAAGAQVVIHNRSRAIVDELASEGMTAATSPADVARQSETILLMLTDTPAVEAVITGADGIVTG